MSDSVNEAPRAMVDLTKSYSDPMKKTKDKNRFLNWYRETAHVKVDYRNNILRRGIR